MHFVYKLNLEPFDFALGNRLFRTARLTKKTDKYKYGDIGIMYLLAKVIIFGLRSSSPVHAKEDILILRKGLTDGLEDAAMIS